MASTGLFNHVGNIHRRMMQINIRDLSNQVVNEMESDRPSYPNYYKEYGKAIAIVRINCEVSVYGIAGLKSEDVENIELGALYPTTTALSYYAESLGLDFDDFLEKVATNVDVLKALEAIAS